MAKTLKFKVENDRGHLVEKTADLVWVKARIRSDLNEQGYKSRFQVRQTSDNLVEIYDSKGHTMTYCYGGFDGYEVLEPQSHQNWPRQ